MSELIALSFLIVSSGVTGAVWRNIRIRRKTRRRLGVVDDDAPLAMEEEPHGEPAPLVTARPWLAYLAGLLVGLGLFEFAGFALSYALAFGLIVALLGAQLETTRVERKTGLVETQLADSLDVMISTLSAGAGVSQALEVAAEEARAPLRSVLENLVHRIRLGDNPVLVLQALESSVRLPTFRLFAAALAVHWEVGGSLTGPLATVARTIRDRIGLSRRVRSLTSQSRASIAAVLGTTYFIALVMWRTDPERMEAFLGTTMGRWFVGAALLLQAVGIVWSTRLSRLPV